jgi:nicotinamide-nucleotide amidase
MINSAYKTANLFKLYYEKTGTKLTLGTIESATGGRICDKITNVPGISEYYKGSIIAYSNETKLKLVGVKKTTLFSFGAVSSETAHEMAEQGKFLLDVDICLSVTGIAGPSGNTPDKPIGLFYLGIFTKDGVNKIEKFVFSGTRNQNKNSAVQASFILLEEYLEQRLKKIDARVLKDRSV